MTGIRIDVTDAIGPALDRLIAGGEDLSPLMDGIGMKMAENTRWRFRDGTAPDGVAWLPSRRARDQGGQTLVDSGRLRDSIVHALQGRDSVAWGTNILYAAAHQFGVTITPRTPGGRLRFRIGDAWVSAASVTLPARPFLGVSDDDREDIADLVAQYIGSLT